MTATRKARLGSGETIYSGSREKVDNWIVGNISEGEGLARLFCYEESTPKKMGALPREPPLLENNIIMAGLLATDTGPVACLLGKERGGGGAMNF